MANLWGLQWYSRNQLDGERRYLLWDGPAKPLLYRTRREARADALKRYGYIKSREDLRAEPHGWRLPIPVRVVIGYSPLRPSGRRM